MAAKRVATSSINWTAFAERVPKKDFPQFQALKAKNESYVRRVAAHPDTLPKIDWNFYKTRIAVPGMVDTFQKSYESLKIPYPTDQGLIAQINDQEGQMRKDLADYSSTIDKKVEELKSELAKLEAQIPFSEMTVEEYFLANPNKAIDPVNNPTLFPHDEEAREITRKLKESGKL